MSKKGNPVKATGGFKLQNLPRGHLHIDQYKRVLRYYERFKEINEGRQRGATFEGQEDDMLAFFMNCHHLKDWVVRDFFIDKADPNYARYAPMCSRLSTEVDRFVDENDCLRLCADICNGTKHLHRTESLHYGEAVRVRTEVHIDETKDDPEVKRVWKFISESGKVWDAFELATDCVSKWKEFLDAHKDMFQKMMARPIEGYSDTHSDLPKDKDDVPGDTRRMAFLVKQRFHSPDSL